MEENHQEITPHSNSSEAKNSQVIIDMSTVEEDIRKLYEVSEIGCVQTLKTLIQQHPHLIQKALVHTSSITIETPLLHVSVSRGHLEFTRLLLDHNPQLAAEVDAFQRTPLHLACANGDMEMVGALLEKNTSSCLVQDLDGFIPLHYAVMSGNIEMMKLLIRARPQSVLMKLNDGGQTVLHLCVEGNHLEGMKLLTDHTLLLDKDFLNTVDDEGNTILDLSLMLRRIEMVGFLLSIEEVKTRKSMESIASSNNVKESQASRKITKIRNIKSKRRKFISMYTKKTKERLKIWGKKNLKYEGDWVQEVQVTMMLVATVIATVTFQAGVNPPGGVWQQDTDFNYWKFENKSIHSGIGLYSVLSNVKNTTVSLAAGTAIMSYQQEKQYWIYLWINTISFLASMSVILMIVSRFPLQNRICSWLLTFAMCIAVVFLALGYLLGVQMVNLISFSQYLEIGSYSNMFPVTIIMCWLVVVGMVGLWQVTHCLKTLFHIVTSKLKSHTASR